MLSGVNTAQPERFWAKFHVISSNSLQEHFCGRHKENSELLFGCWLPLAPFFCLDNCTHPQYGSGWPINDSLCSIRCFSNHSHCIWDHCNAEKWSPCQSDTFQMLKHGGSKPDGVFSCIYTSINFNNFLGHHWLKCSFEPWRRTSPCFTSCSCTHSALLHIDENEEFGFMSP